MVAIDNGHNGKASIHALVIGVGHYHNGLPGLSGAAESALAFADWLADTQCLPGLSLGTLEILASSASGTPLQWRGSVLVPPTLGAVQAAVDAWHDRAHQNTDNQSVFFFCGHGVEIGDLQSLLVADSDPTNQGDPFRHNIAFNDFLNGMRSCAARQQLYVLDACRELPPGANKWDDSVPLGWPLRRYNKDKAPKNRARDHVVLQATSATQKAWQGNRGGWFTEALLTVLEGAASDNRFSTVYTVNTRSIADTIKHSMKMELLPAPAGPQQPVRAGQGDFDLHVVDRPVVPVVVTRKIANDNVGQRFTASVAQQEVCSFSCAGPEPWRVRLPIGAYSFARATDVEHKDVSVPGTRVELP